MNHYVAVNALRVSTPGKAQRIVTGKYLADGTAETRLISHQIAPGTMIKVGEDIGEEDCATFLRLRAIREPTATELRLYELANGAAR